MSFKETVAAFDFDGTITYRDTLLPFLLYGEGTIGTFSKLFTVTPSLALYAMKKLSRQTTKETVLTRFFQGKKEGNVRQLGTEFAHTVLSKHLRPEAVKKIKWHQQQGHRCILISANLDVYLEPWAKQNGFEHVICSQVQFIQGQATGKLIGLNCWGPEKKRRLEEYLGNRADFRLYAYGDSLGDKDLLEMADYSFYRTFGEVT